MSSQQATRPKLNNTTDTTTCLLQQLNDFRQRQTLMEMETKQQQAKLEYATHAKAAKAAELKHLRDQENDLAIRIRAQTSTVLELTRQTHDGQHRFRQAQDEEPSLHTLSEARLQQNSDLQTEWQAQQARLNAVCCMWSNDQSYAAPLLAAIEAVDRELDELRAEEQLVIAMKPVTTSVPPRGDIGARENDESRRTAINEQILAEGRALNEARAAHTRKFAQIEREINDLTSRCTELEQWLSEAHSARVDLQSSISSLRTAADSGICHTCSHIPTGLVAQ